MSVDRDSNSYTLIFATIMVIGVAVLLSFLAEFYKARIYQNQLLEKKYQIIGSVDNSVTKLTVDDVFAKSVKTLLISADGNAIEADVNEVLDIDLKKEMAKAPNEQQLPLYVYGSGKDKRYIVPMHGNGLWDFISGFLSVKPDYNTVYGAKFSHVGETPGLGAEITKDWFQNNFKNEKLFNTKGEFVGIEVLKGKGNKGQASTPHQVDGMSGATITGDGVEAMITKSVSGYISYFNKNK